MNAVMAVGEISSNGWDVDWMLFGLVAGAVVGIISAVLFGEYGKHVEEKDRAREAAKEAHPAGKGRDEADGYARGGPVPKPSPYRYDVEGWIEVPEGVVVSPEANEVAAVPPSLRLVDTDAATLRLVDTDDPSKGPKG